ncbi:MAG: hypothetical protein JXA10_04260 [Anaerolineae bacterium]|nr:hypothetical protein [Anaerolineae bacterium]
MGVRVRVASEMGQISATSLTLIEGAYTGTYVNAAYTAAQDNKTAILTVRITSGRGAVTLRSE